MKAIARSLVRLHPPAWRARYGDEVEALVEVGPVRLGDVGGLLRNCITERVLSLYEPSRHITAYRFISGITLLTYFSVLLVASLLVASVPFVAGYGLQRLAGPFPPALMDGLWWLYLLVFLGLVIPSWVVKALRMKTGNRPVRLGAYGMLAFLIGLTSDLSFRQIFISVWLPWVLVTQLFEPEGEVRWPGHELFDALGRLRSARSDLRWAGMELDRCEGLCAGREPGPELRAARAEMDRLSANEASAMASLVAMGYHARYAAPEPVSTRAPGP